MSKLIGLFTTFRIRKRVLAFADAFIVVVAGLFANFPLPLYADAIDRADQFAIFFLSVIMCFSALLFFGAYNKLWRYLNRYALFLLPCERTLALAVCPCTGMYR